MTRPRLSLWALLLLGCTRTPTPSTAAQAERILPGCLDIVARSETLRAAWGGALGDSLPNTFRLELTTRLVPAAQNPDRLNVYQALWRDEFGEQMGGWMQRGDSLGIRFSGAGFWPDSLHRGWGGYGLWSDFLLIGRDSLRGSAIVRTHRAFFEYATVSARRFRC